MKICQVFYKPMHKDKTESERGSAATASEPRFLVIGKILKPHGVRGEVRVRPLTDDPARFSWLEKVYLGEDALEPLTVETVRFHKELVLVKFVELDGRDTVADLHGQLLLVAMEDAVPLEEGEYYLHQLYGLAVYSDEDVYLGELVNIIETGANNVFEVEGEDGKMILLPDIPSVIADIDFENGRLTAHILEGLL